MKLYLGNKMVGKQGFGFEWFDHAKAQLLTVPFVKFVFSPADHDRNTGFEGSKLAGTFEDMERHGFSRRDALRADWAWIGSDSDGMIAGPDWTDSPGTISEIACHQGLFLPVWEFDVFMDNWCSKHLLEMKLPPIIELGGPKTGMNTRELTPQSFGFKKG